MRTTVKGLVAAIAAMAATASLAAVPADAAPVERAAKCGYYRAGTPAVQAWYNHCGGGKVWIKVFHTFGDDTFWCVGPGHTSLGVWPEINDAVYDNRTC
ncbi:DUF6355 family natural product biosynthesis protein [Allokutzneria sp. NRRL B-24872]|uniref:DUF6355 family natural product biosynthesis protein n=1 Tax=Allokutzneria sp. NRRL B-24872 TaxID=1137961 RepID=UPI000A3A4F16|nr:DUF6355 family natural product biosynthesis protein [Allokutzneria sp. NRRL B-24872]